MTERNLTRRRVMVGAGAVGIAGLAGGPVVFAQEDGNGGEQPADEQAAIRVAHASPDAPDVDIRVTSQGGTGGTDDGGEDDDEDEPLIESLSFREVSNYAEVEAGTYQVEIVASDDGGLLEDLLGGDDGEGNETDGDSENGEDGDQVVYEDEVDVESGTTYTVVAYGELAGSQTGTGAGTDDSNGTGNETDDGGDDIQTTTGDGGSDREFQVEVLEDDLSDPGEDMYRVRIFHAVPDVDEMSVSSRPQEDDGVIDDVTGDDEEENGGDGNGTDDGGQGTGDGEETHIESLSFGDDETYEHESGDYVLMFRDESGDDGQTGDGTDTGTDADDSDGDDGQDDDVRETDISPNSGVVYSGFALGYFDPEQAGGGAEDDTLGGNQTDGEDDEEDDVSEDGEDEEFEFVTTVDSQDGERDEGGS